MSQISSLPSSDDLVEVYHGDDIVMDVNAVYDTMVKSFKEKKDKKELIRFMTEYCRLETTTPQDIYDLKKKLELDFSKDVNCEYCYTFGTPVNYGCDLREIFYDRNNKITDGGEELLEIFNQKKLPDIWHIMTDIDDTLYPNTEHGTYIAGSDISWHQKTPYPGIRTFYNKFYAKLPDYSQYSTILSATPGCLKNSKLKDKNGLLHGILHIYGFIQGVESKLQVATYSGNIITNCVSAYCGTSNTTDVDSISDLFKLFGNTKFERFKQYLNIFPEYKILFFGDNGQGDVLAGKQMVEYTKEYTDRCHVFIHKVSENGRTFKTVSEESQQIDRLNFFTNYYEASKQLQELGIFNADDVDAVKNEINTQIKVRENSRFANLYNTLSGGKTKKTKNYKYNSNKTKKHKKRSTKRNKRKQIKNKTR